MPRYTDSEILKNFEKIISEKGAISKKAEKKTNHETRSPKEINDLYHVKPDTAKGMDYDRHIGQLAHKDMAVVLPAHDKLNGLVETDQERQNIMINLVLKPTHGHLGAKKYAESQLIGSLVRVANDLDNQDIQDLRVLADACISDLEKQAGMWDDATKWLSELGGDAVETGKGVGGGALIGGVLGALIGGVPTAGVGAVPGAYIGAGIGAAAGGLLASIGKTSPQAKSVVFNCDDTLTQLADLLKDYPTHATLLELQEELNKTKLLADKYSSISAGAKASPQEVETVTKAYISQMEKIKPLAVVFKTKSKAGEFASQDSSFWSKVKTPLHWFSDDEVEDVNDSLSSLIKAINNAEEGIEALKKIAISATTPAKTDATPVAAKAPTGLEELETLKKLMPSAFGK